MVAKRIMEVVLVAVIMLAIASVGMLSYFIWGII